MRSTAPRRVVMDRTCDGQTHFDKLSCGHVVESRVVRYFLRGRLRAGSLTYTRRKYADTRACPLCLRWPNERPVTFARPAGGGALDSGNNKGGSRG